MYRTYRFWWNAERDCETTERNATHVLVLYECTALPIEAMPSRSWQLFAL